MRGQGRPQGPQGRRPAFQVPQGRLAVDPFTANARWHLTDSGRLNLPKIGAVKVKWSRTLPTTPTSVTVTTRKRMPSGCPTPTAPSASISA
jgi:putative transposase